MDSLPYPTDPLERQTAIGCSTPLPPRKIFSAMENCYVKRPDGTPRYISMEMRPVSDVQKFVFYDEPVGYDENGAFIRWDRDGYVRREAKDGTITEWFSRPTLQIAINTLPHCNFFKFNKDGSVLVINEAYTWFWGPLVEVQPIMNVYDNYNPVRDCGCGGDFRCCGYDPYDPYD